MFWDIAAVKGFGRAGKMCLKTVQVQLQISITPFLHFPEKKNTDTHTNTHTNKHTFTYTHTNTHTHIHTNRHTHKTLLYSFQCGL